MMPNTASTIRYVKFGPGGRWEQACLDEGRTYFGWETDPHDHAMQGDWPAVRQAYADHGQKPALVSANANEMQTFYELGRDCLWISFARGQLWWGFAEEQVQALPQRLPDGRQHYRQIIGGWRCTDALSQPLRIDRLSSRLTQLAGYRRTICKVAEEAYLRRILAGEADPLVAAAQDRLNELAMALQPIIAGLHWSDFELFVDLLFSRIGWRRVSSLGGRQQDVDMILELPATGDQLAVQVKSKIDQQGARDCSERLQALGFSSRPLLACHSPIGRIEADDFDLWDGAELARRAARCGLADWLIDHSR